MSSISALLAAALLLTATSPAVAESLDMEDGVDSEEALPDAQPEAAPSLHEASVVIDFATHLGAGWARLDEDDRPAAEFMTGIFDVKLGVGTFVGSHVKVGYEATLGDRQVLGDADTTGGLELSDSRGPIEGGTWYFLPLGAYLELYPSSEVGVYLGFHGGVGTFFPADYIIQGNLHGAWSASVELGYDVELSERTRGAIVARYGATRFKGFYIDEAYNDALTSNDFSIAARVSMF